MIKAVVTALTLFENEKMRYLYRLYTLFDFLVKVLVLFLNAMNV